MQDVANPDVPLVIGGKQFHLRFGLRAFLTLQREFGLKDANEVQAHIANNTGDLELMITVVWAALQTNHREISKDDLIDMLDGEDLVAVAAGLSTAMAAAAPPDSPKAKG